ncbi:hypothetical protein [Serratia sp. Se-RSBMAAmG]|uniref:hypothetical protein n=1 Tax=Serratia sp. Se-RSBMAAmG TaxID=3043305 RepID=UPI0024AF0697|nr:hypothetical protein [Serratia sp. Se-RSBMAAmG]MDI6977214.1 hypothetical protein [Serratia sp. Se-RSBMAAmG]
MADFVSDHDMIWITEACEIIDGLRAENENGNNHSVQEEISEIFSGCDLSVFTENEKAVYQNYIASISEELSQEQKQEVIDDLLYVIHESIVCFNEPLARQVIKVRWA